MTSPRRDILAAMAEDLTPGVHEGLVTHDLRSRIDRARADGWLIEMKSVDDASLADVLARHVHDHVRDAISGLPQSMADRRRVQIETVNRVLQALTVEPPGGRPGSTIDQGGTILLEVKQPLADRGNWLPTRRPGIPLRDSALLVNGHKDLQIGTQVALEILSADRIDLLCAFVRFAGLRLIRAELQEFLLQGPRDARNL